MAHPPKGFDKLKSLSLPVTEHSLLLTEENSRKKASLPPQNPLQKQGKQMMCNKPRVVGGPP